MTHLISIPIGFHIAHAGVPNLSLNMYPMSISIDEHVPLKFPMTKNLNKYFRILKLYRYIFSCLKFNLLQMYIKCTLQTGKCTLGVHAPQVGNLCYTVLV